MFVFVRKSHNYAQKCNIALASLVRIREARTSLKNKNRLEKKNDKGASFSWLFMINYGKE
jgi:hypothetical protein